MKKTRRKLKRKNQFAIIPLILIVLISLSAIIVVAFSNRKDPVPLSSLPESGSLQDTASSSDVSLLPTPTPTTIPTPEPVIEDTVAGRFFGPVYPVTEPREVQRYEVRGLYIGMAASGELLDQRIELAKNSAINALIVDVKESHQVYFMAENKLANEIGAVRNNYNVEELVRKCKENNIRLIGRMVIFKDVLLAQARPDLCIQDKNGNPVLYKSLEGGKPFVSPYKREVWEYNIDIAVEAIKLGFDEIQFDYVRFPTGNRAEIQSEYHGPEGEVPTKAEAINRFLLEAKMKIQDELGVPLGADIFGIVMTSKLYGELIGQDWESLGEIGLDSLSPMIYPSHYARGTVMNGITFNNPDGDTFEFLDAVFKQEKFSRQAGFSALRPYIQAYSYTQEQIFGQIDALAANGINEYIYWNPGAAYSLDNLKKN